jgi:hypothetical protein
MLFLSLTLLCSMAASSVQSLVFFPVSLLVLPIRMFLCISLLVLPVFRAFNSARPRRLELLSLPLFSRCPVPPPPSPLLHSAQVFFHFLRLYIGTMTSRSHFLSSPASRPLTFSSLSPAHQCLSHSLSKPVLLFSTPTPSVSSSILDPQYCLLFTLCRPSPTHVHLILPHPY